ncbi:hypothetical protein BGV06_19670 [Clostridioides difficile]|nr:hypothetical protein BGV06_19670 [Clostridioides difficile]
MCVLIAFSFCVLGTCSALVSLVFFEDRIFFFPAEDGIRDRRPARGLGGVDKGQVEAGCITQVLTSETCVTKDAICNFSTNFFGIF